VAVGLGAVALRQLRSHESKKPLAILKSFLRFFSEHEAFFILGHILDINDASQTCGVEFMALVGGPDGQKYLNGIQGLF